MAYGQNVRVFVRKYRWDVVEIELFWLWNGSEQIDQYNTIAFMTDNQTENENGLKKQIACIRWYDIKKCSTLLEISYEIYFVGIHTV